jgi:PBP1b-binding outer membrane lipoprotein LpoB
MFDDASRYTTARLAGLLALAILLSGCASQKADAPSPAPTASAASTASTIEPTLAPAVTATVAPLNPSDPSSWIIGFAGVGPLVLGADMTSTKESMTGFTQTVWDDCPARSVVTFTEAGTPSFVIADQGSDGIIQQVVVETGENAADSATSSSRTSAGIGIGATLDELTIAYPSITYQDAGTPIAQYVLASGQG